MHGKGLCKGPGESLQTFMSGTANPGFSKTYFQLPCWTPCSPVSSLAES